MALLHGVKSISIPCLGVDHECDRQTDGQTDILVVNAALNHVALRGQNFWREAQWSSQFAPN